MTKIKLCYVISYYDLKTDSHYYHIYELLRTVSSDLKIFLFIENKKCFTPPDFCSYYVQKFSSPPFNLIERLICFVFLNLIGYKTIYVHYSIFSSILAAMVIKIFGGRTLFWYLQMYNLYRHPWWEILAFRFNLKLVDTLVTGNLKMKEFFQQTYRLDKQRIAVLPLWINLQRFQPKILKMSSKHKTVLFVHTLSRRKGADLIVPVARKVIRFFPRVQFLIIGEGELKDRITQEIFESKLTKNIRLLGKVSNEEIVSYYQSANVFFMPSKEEEMGRVLLEAMACGLPIVATNTIGPQAIMSDHQKQFLVSQGDVEGFSDKIIQLLRRPKLPIQLANIGRKVVKAYDIKKVSRSFLSLAAGKVDPV